MTTSKSKAVRYDSIAYRIERDGAVVAMALKLSNERWGLFDPNEKKLTDRSFEKPGDVAQAFDEINENAQE